MSSLKEICSGLPLDPLPQNRGRDPRVPHAPVRTPNLTADEERVSKNTSHIETCEQTAAAVHLVFSRVSCVFKDEGRAAPQRVEGGVEDRQDDTYKHEGNGGKTGSATSVKFPNRKRCSTDQQKRQTGPQSN
ncbi:hypothetical protein INR49_010421 [Caranx melampygus]|nr:hypothetical protein INR49_010421 [Caranx melampygus]